MNRTRADHFSGATVAICKLTLVTPDGQQLLHETELVLRPAEIVLLVGSSGTGKSALLRLLGGVLGKSWTASGEITVGGETHDLAASDSVLGSLVFQDFALFLDLSARDNLSIVRDHGRALPDHVVRAAEGMIAGIPDNLPSELSGGQRQRVAIARAILADHPLLLLDEPNSGLDRRGSERLLNAVAELSRTLGTSVLVVAHHFHDVLPHAHRVLFLDHSAARLVELPRNATDIEHRLLGLSPREEETESTQKATVEAEPATAARPSGQSDRLHLRANWLTRFFLRELWSHALSPGVLIYVSMASVLIGFTSTWFTFTYLPQSAYILPIISDDILTNVGLSNLRLTVPLLTCILLAARSGAVITSRFGHATYAREIDAMRNLGIPYRTYLYGVQFCALVLAAIILTAVVSVSSSFVSLLTWATFIPDATEAVWRDSYFEAFSWGRDFIYESVAWVVLKVALCGAATAVVGIVMGRLPKRSVRQINTAVAAAIALGLSVVLLIHTVLASVEFGQPT